MSYATFSFCLKNRSYIEVSTRNNNGVTTKTIDGNQLRTYEKILCRISRLVWPYGAFFTVIMIGDAKYFTNTQHLLFCCCPDAPIMKEYRWISITTKYIGRQAEILAH